MPPLTGNLRGIIFMILGMACFSLGDMFVKLASQQLPSGQVMMVLGLGCGMVFWVMLKFQRQAIVVSEFFERPVLLRNAGEVLGATCMFAALALSPLSTVTAIIQTAPILMTLAAILFLGEKVGIHRISAIVIGFLGVLIIIRPGTTGFDQYSLLSLMAVVGMTMRDVGARLTRTSISSVMLSFYSAVTLTLTGLVITLFFGKVEMPNLTTNFYLFGLVIAASLGFIWVTQSVRIAEISVVSPFRYSRLLFGMSLGVIAFDEIVDNYTIIGALITIGAGIYIWVRENR